jgi:heme-degrading monooxygenase HmoA
VYARVVRYEGVSEGEWEIGAGWFRDDYLPAIKDSAGFEGAYLFRHRDGGVTMTITFWADAAAAAASGEAVQRHLNKWQELTGRSPAIETFEVIVAPD